MEDTLLSSKTLALAIEKGFIFDNPTQSLLQKWLRDIHNTIVIVEYDISAPNPYSVRVYHSGTVYVFFRCLTYEQALEEGLYKTLKLWD